MRKRTRLTLDEFRVRVRALKLDPASRSTIAAAQVLVHGKQARATADALQLTEGAVSRAVARLSAYCPHCGVAL